jgi:hypothetical protein
VSLLVSQLEYELANLLGYWWGYVSAYLSECLSVYTLAYVSRCQLVYASVSE